MLRRVEMYNPSISHKTETLAAVPYVGFSPEILQIFGSDQAKFNKMRMWTYAHIYTYHCLGRLCTLRDDFKEYEIAEFQEMQEHLANTAVQLANVLRRRQGQI